MKRIIALVAFLALPRCELAFAGNCVSVADALPKGAMERPLVDYEMAALRREAIAAGRHVPDEIAMMIAAHQEPTDTWLIVGVTKDGCVDGAAEVSREAWGRIIGRES